MDIQGNTVVLLIPSQVSPLLPSEVVFVEWHNSDSWWMLVVRSHSGEVGGGRVEHLYHDVPPSFAFSVLSFWADAFRANIFFFFQNGGVICICGTLKKEDNEKT